MYNIFGVINEGKINISTLLLDLTSTVATGINWLYYIFQLKQQVYPVVEVLHILSFHINTFDNINQGLLKLVSWQDGM